MEKNRSGPDPDRRFVPSDVGVVMWIYGCYQEVSAFKRNASGFVKWAGVGICIGCIALGCKAQDGWDAFTGKTPDQRKGAGP